MNKVNSLTLKHYSALVAGLTAASGAQAAVVYTDVDTEFGVAYGYDPDCDCNGILPDPIEINFDGLGGAEFELKGYFSRQQWSGFPSYIDNASAVAYAGSGGVGQQFIAGSDAGQADANAPAALQAGHVIGPNGTLTSDNTLGIERFWRAGGGNFVQTPDASYPAGAQGLGEVRYLGVQFAFADAPGDTYYGWIGVEMVDAANGRVVGYAYEDTGGAIFAGATVPIPPALPLLASGVAGLLAFRRRKATGSQDKAHA